MCTAEGICQKKGGGSKGGLNGRMAFVFMPFLYFLLFSIAVDTRCHFVSVSGAQRKSQAPTHFAKGPPIFPVPIWLPSQLPHHERQCSLRWAPHPRIVHDPLRPPCLPLEGRVCPPSRDSDGELRRGETANPKPPRWQAAWHPLPDLRAQTLPLGKRACSLPWDLVRSRSPSRCREEQG